MGGGLNLDKVYSGTAWLIPIENKTRVGNYAAPRKTTLVLFSRQPRLKSMSPFNRALLTRRDPLSYRA